MLNFYSHGGANYILMKSMDVYIYLYINLS